MQDQYGRVIDYLRISVTDQCNLRCIYCMPKEEHIRFLPKEELLTDEEIVRLCRIFADTGISRIKFTGGEPLLRQGLAELVLRVGQIPGVEEMTLTTNGVLLKEKMKALYHAGISSVNISLDAADGAHFSSIAGIDYFEQVLEGFEEAKKYPITVKLNCVLARGLNEEQWLSLAEYAKESKVDVRFIEMMPIGAGRQYKSGTQDAFLMRIKEKYGDVKEQKEKGNGPAVYYKVEGFLGRIGFISAMSHKFCSQCNRIRLTADGVLKPCLQYESHVDLKSMLRQGRTDREIKELITKSIFEKPKEHRFQEQQETKGVLAGNGMEKKKMSEIGG